MVLFFGAWENSPEDEPSGNETSPSRTAGLWEETVLVHGTIDDLRYAAIAGRLDPIMRNCPPSYDGGINRQISNVGRPWRSEITASLTRFTLPVDNAR